VPKTARRRATHLVILVQVPAAHLTAAGYLRRLDPLMESLLDLERRNPDALIDPDLAARAGPTPADRYIEVAAQVHPEPDHVWATVPALPGLFATGASVAELREALAEAVRLWMEPTVR
jgi:hypothetical protein